MTATPHAQPAPGPALPAGVAVSGRSLTKTYAGAPGAPGARGATQALAGVDVDVPAGALTALVGPSGSGKTTLLHVLSGLVTPDEGSVLVAPRVPGTPPVAVHALSDDARADLRRDRMGFVFQRLNLLPALTVGENVALPLLLAGVRRDQVRARVLEVLGQVGLEGYGPARPDTLSGGEAQRVAVARAVAGRPAVLWADEPTGALDTTAAAGVLAVLRDVVRTGSAVVVVTHDRALAAGADHVVALRDGRVEA